MFDLITGPPLLLDCLNTAGSDILQKLSRDLFLNVGLNYKNSDRFWEKVELYRVKGLKGEREEFCEENQHLDLDIIAHFGTNTPSADQYLLHFAPGWDRNQHNIPIILVHGAGLDATSYTDLFAMGFKGLQQQLMEIGYRVFAVTFPHAHGDNFFQAEQLADAISRVKDLTGVEKVDLIAHSKGGIATRIYLSNMANTTFRHDVRRYIMLGVPNMGLDFSFRNPLFNYLVYVSGSNGTMSWDKILSLGTMVDTSKRSIYSDGCFPGQKQMLYRWDDEYELDVLQQDWWTTYYGGWGFVSHSHGIKRAIEEGGSLVEKLNKKGLEAGIEFSLMAGDNHIFNAVPGEESGPSDGIVFVDSALYSESLEKRGAVLKEKTILPVNHMELLFSRKVCRWIDKQLRE